MKRYTIHFAETVQDERGLRLETGEALVRPFGQRRDAEMTASRMAFENPGVKYTVMDGMRRVVSFTSKQADNYGSL